MAVGGVIKVNAKKYGTKGRPQDIGMKVNQYFPMLKITVSYLKTPESLRKIE